MTSGRVLRNVDAVSADWLTEVLGRQVESFAVSSEASNWSSQHPIVVTFADGAAHHLRLKLCLGSTFGRSEVDYYTRYYVGLTNAPLVRCWHAEFEDGVGYHLLLDDLAPTYRNRRGVVPTLEYGLAVAEALGRLHRHHWCSRPAPDQSALDRYFAQITPGVANLERATRLPFRPRFATHERSMRTRWARPGGMTLLHGDLNSTNILTPQTAEQPVYFLDHQPFDWSLLYGVAANDLAYMTVLWWPSEAWAELARPVLRHWYDQLGAKAYSWEEAQMDWALSVEQCLHVPLVWCSKPDTLESMRWLWEIQLDRVQRAMGALG